jgi:type IV secretion system protein VirD4
MGDNPFDIIGNMKDVLGPTAKGAKVGLRIGREIAGRRLAAQVEAELGPEVAEAVLQAARAGHDTSQIIREARRARERQKEREELLAAPPPVFGSARFATARELGPYLAGPAAFDRPSSLLLGAYEDPDSPAPLQFVHWDGEGHLLTVARTRTGKSQTTIIPNLLRYKGSTIVLDLKGELYAATSKWRAENVGPVYRLAPLDDGTNKATAGYARHGFNPLAHIRTEEQARALADQFFPHDPKASEFFRDDATAFMTAVILYVMEKAPPEQRNLATVRRIATEPSPALKVIVEAMRTSSSATVREAANNVLGKSHDRGLPNLRDSMFAKLSLWSTPGIVDNVSRNDVDFAQLKERPTTIYIDVPFEQIDTYGPWVRVVLRSALDAMVKNKTQPEIPVLFVLDEFLSLGAYPEFRDAIRTHAGAGVRLWFFMQDIATIEGHYPNGGWKPFFTCAVKQYFGLNDYFTADFISRSLGQSTVAYLSSNTGGNVSSSGSGTWADPGGSTNVGYSSGESVQLAQRPLLQPDEVMEMLAGWKGEGWRMSLLDLSDPRPFPAHLSAHTKSATCMARLGPYRPHPES